MINKLLSFIGTLKKKNKKKHCENNITYYDINKFFNDLETLPDHGCPLLPQGLKSGNTQNFN